MVELPKDNQRIPGAPSTRRAIWVRALRIPCCRWARKRTQGGTTRWSRLWVRSLELPWRGSSFVSCTFSHPRCGYIEAPNPAEIIGQEILDSETTYLCSFMRRSSYG